MRVWVALITFWLILAILGVAHAQASVTPRQVAKRVAREYLAPLTSPDDRRVRVTSFPCRPAPGRWVNCRVRVKGAVTYRAIVQVTEDGKNWKVWIPRMHSTREER